ncbi:hypothetical protein LguiA_033243 [Lonicera macranthoides]
MPYPENSCKVVFQLQFKHHDTSGQFFTRFKSQDDARDFMARFTRLTVICECEFKIDDFRPNKNQPNIPINIRNWIASRGWTPIVENHDLVREFYF